VTQRVVEGVLPVIPIGCHTIGREKTVTRKKIHGSISHVKISSLEKIEVAGLGRRKYLHAERDRP